MLLCTKGQDKDKRDARADAIADLSYKDAIEPSARIGLHLPSES